MSGVQCPFLSPPLPGGLGFRIRGLWDWSLGLIKFIMGLRVGGLLGLLKLLNYRRLVQVLRLLGFRLCEFRV